MGSAVQQLCLNKAGGHTHLCSEHFKKFLRETYPAEGTSIPPPKPEWWQKLLELTQYMWQHMEIPTDMVWTILFLIPKVNTDTQVIFLLETLWKLVEAIIDTYLR